MLLTIESQLSAMSLVVRHRFPTAGAHVHGVFVPQSQRLKVILPPALASACPNCVY